MLIRLGIAVYAGDPHPSEFTWDDEAGTVTEAIDEGADGVIDEVRVMPQPELR